MAFRQTPASEQCAGKPAFELQNGYSPPHCFVETYISGHGPFGSLSFGAHQTYYQVLSSCTTLDAGLGVLRCGEVALFYIRM